MIDGKNLLIGTLGVGAITLSGTSTSPTVTISGSSPTQSALSIAQGQKFTTTSGSADTVFIDGYANPGSASTGSYTALNVSNQYQAVSFSTTGSLIGANISTGATTNANLGKNIGVKSTVQMSGGTNPTTTEAIAFDAQLSNAAATMTNAYGLKVEDTANQAGGVITNNYGAYVGTLIGTNKWSFYASDAASRSYFAGNVGIGTTSPAYKLDVVGDINVTGNFRVNGAIFSGGGGGPTLSEITSISNTSGDITLAPAVGSGAVQINSGAASTSPTTGALIVSGGIGVSGGIYSGGAISSGSSVSAATSMYTPQLYGTSTPSGNIKIDGTSNATKGNVLLASGGGSVGIGTTSPAGKLHIEGSNTAYTLYAKGSGQNVAYIEGSGASSYASLMVNNYSNRDAVSLYGDASKTSGSMLSISTGNADFTGTGLEMDMGVYSSGNFTGKFLDFKNSGGTGGTGGPTKFSVDSNGSIYSTGYVGIGTAINTNYKMAVSSNSNTGIVADFDDNSAGRNSGAILTIDSDSADNTGYNLLSITNQNVTSTKFVVRGDGNVGIGTTTPLAKLGVAGGINVGTQVSRSVASTERGQLASGSTLLQTTNASTTVDWNNGNMQEIDTFVCDGSKTITFNNMKDGAVYSLLISGAGAHSGICVFSAAGRTFIISGGTVAPTASASVMFTFAVFGNKIVYSMTDNLL